MHWLDKHAGFRDQLSPYVDGALSLAEATRLEAHLAACDACRADLDELRSTVSAVRELPRADVPRSFALTPRMLEPRTAAPGASAPPLALGMRLASAGVAIFLAVVVIGDLSDAGGGGARQSADESVGESRTLTELSAAEADREEAAGGAEVPAPGVTDAAAAYDAQAPAEDSSATTAPRAESDTAACPLGVTGESSSTGTTGGVGGPSSGGGGAGTGTSPDTPAATPTPQPVATLTAQPGVDSSVACDELGIAGALTPAAAAPEPEPAGDTAQESLSADGALEAEDGGGVSTLRLVEIALAGALIALLAGVSVELALRRRAA